MDLLKSSCAFSSATIFSVLVMGFTTEREDKDVHTQPACHGSWRMRWCGVCGVCGKVITPARSVVSVNPNSV